MFELALIIIILLLVIVLWPLTLYVLPDMLLEDKDELPSGELSSWPILNEVESSVKMEPFDPHHPWQSLPHVVNRKYLNYLVQGIQYLECVTVVTGPRDSGKTTGISILVEVWREKGHTVVDINLKGCQRKLHGKMSSQKQRRGCIG